MRPAADLATGTPVAAAPAVGRETRALRRPWPFRRVAVVLSGGGALAAYEVGALKVLEAVGLRPAILAGVSAGAINAAVWLSLGYRTAPLEQIWRSGERRGGEEGRSWWSPDHLKKKKKKMERVRQSRKYVSVWR